MKTRNGSEGGWEMSEICSDSVAEKLCWVLLWWLRRLPQPAYTGFLTLVCCFCSPGSRTRHVHIFPIVAFHAEFLIFHRCSLSFPATPWSVVIVGTASFVVPVCQCLEPAGLDWNAGSGSKVMLAIMWRRCAYVSGGQKGVAVLQGFSFRFWDILLNGDKHSRVAVI